MKIFIQGRKRGYSVLYPFPTPDEFYNFAMDVQSINAQNQAYYYGKSLYSIAFTRGGRIFSKYVLGYDVQRSNLGNISFSIFIPDGKFLRGTDVVDLLDTLSTTYFNTYAPNFSIPDCQENWGLFTEIANRYDAKLINVDRLDIEHLERGAQDAAFIYYATPQALAEFFENPYQSAYSSYSQVFLISEQFLGKAENPVTAFKHNPSANLTSEIDLSNRRYRIILKDAAFAKVTLLYADGRKTPLFSNDHFHKKDVLKITWSKKYYDSAEITGDFDKVKQYLEVDEVRKTVSVKPVNLKINKKDLQPQFVLRGKLVDVDVTCKNGRGKSITPQNGVFHFEGEEVFQDWTFSVKKTPYITHTQIIRPESSPEVFEIKLNEQKRISIRVIDEQSGFEVSSVTIYRRRDNGRQTLPGSSITFVDEELDEACELEFRARRYYPKEDFSFIPREVKEDFIKVQLKPEPRPERETDFDLDSPDNHGHRVHKKEKSLQQRILLPCLIGLVLISSLVLNVVLLKNNRSLKNEMLVAEAKEYIEGTELLCTKLEEYRDATKKKWLLNSALTEICSERANIDAANFSIESWKVDSYRNYNAKELKRFYSICSKDKAAIGKLQKRVKDIWGNDIKQQRLNEICDSLDAFISHPERYLPVTEPNAAQSADSTVTQKDEHGVEEPTTESGSSTMTDLSSEEVQKKGIIGRIFGKRNK